jgi:MYXO-CTERM domain-containing protein
VALTCQSELVPTDDNNECTIDSCDPQVGVLNEDVANGLICDVDNDPLTRDICLTGTCAPSACGDGFEDGVDGEQCDDGNLVDGDGCQSTCLDPVCGDDVVDDGEDCDDGNDVDGDGCTAACEDEFCGDGVQQDDEDCDDGNDMNEDGCSGACVIEACGDGVKQDALGEQCDDGNDVDGDGCEANCTLPSCGNSIVDEPEQCDDGNEINGDGCSASCTTESSTGEGGNGAGGGADGGGGTGPAGGGDDGCSCRVGSRSDANPWGVVLLGALAFALSRRRRRG